jgi:hypothetical protein
VRQALSIRYELKRACGLEEEAVSVERFGRNIRNPQVHVPPSLTATCQLQQLSLKAERNTYIWPIPAPHGNVADRLLLVKADAQNREIHKTQTSGW